MPKAQRPPLLADPKVRQKLEAASAASGLSINQLADLIAESGVVTKPPSDGITERYTLEDLGKRLWSQLAAVPKDGRAKWFAGLVDSQKTAIIVLLRDRGYRTEVIARDLAIDPKDVMRTWNAYADQMGAQVVGVRLGTIAGQLQMAAERAAEIAADKGDGSLYWRIHKELLSAYQSIGIVDKAIHRVEVSHKLNEQQMEEIEAIAQLRQKQETRKIEVEELETAEVQGDELPDDLEEDYDE